MVNATDSSAATGMPGASHSLADESQPNQLGRSRAVAASGSGQGLSLEQPNLNSIQLIEEHDLIKCFMRTVAPPILAEIETQKLWSTMRQVIVSMSNASNMVRNSILAFTRLLYCQGQTARLSSPSDYYRHASRELRMSTHLEPDSSSRQNNSRQYNLATIFFLCYVDILEGRVTSVHSYLKQAFDIFQQGKRHGFRPVEVRLFSWIRLLDARAVSAGGEGLFLSDNSSESLMVRRSPGSVSDSAQDEDESEVVQDWDVEDVLFQTLYHPGVHFFQKIQSFMGRISKIDPWHRSRGTVEDEMEVMQIAAQILHDLRELYNERPLLMDHAVKGNLTSAQVSANLAFAITRAFRTYLSNYYASKIHLHRVAYKHLPLSHESTEALVQIRHLTKLLVANLEPDAVLPVNQLWPLLMLGSEEEDPAERKWIREQILGLQKVATNASITAHVLQQVQERQDASKTRVDIRSVMHDVFDSCFAII